MLVLLEIALARGLHLITARYLIWYPFRKEKLCIARYCPGVLAESNSCLKDVTWPQEVHTVVVAAPRIRSHVVKQLEPWRAAIYAFTVPMSLLVQILLILDISVAMVQESASSSRITIFLHSAPRHKVRGLSRAGQPIRHQKHSTPDWRACMCPPGYCRFQWSSRANEWCIHSSLALWLQIRVAHHWCLQ